MWNWEVNWMTYSKFQECCIGAHRYVYCLLACFLATYPMYTFPCQQFTTVFVVEQNTYIYTHTHTHTHQVSVGPIHWSTINLPRATHQRKEPRPFPRRHQLSAAPQLVTVAFRPLSPHARIFTGLILCRCPQLLCIQRHHCTLPSSFQPPTLHSLPPSSPLMFPESQGKRCDKDVPLWLSTGQTFIFCTLTRCEFLY